MGAQIALHCANAGIPALLLDLTADVARRGSRRRVGSNPIPSSPPTPTSSSRPADSTRISSRSPRRLDRRSRRRTARHQAAAARACRRGATAGIDRQLEHVGDSDRSDRRRPLGRFRRHWLGTHFFNPPRYLRLLEIIPTPDTDPAVVAAMVKFGDHVLGKGVVIAKDTPNFIANHIGLYGVARSLDALASGRYTIEEIDAITGPALGRPGSATFRTMDIAGIDVLAHVLRNLSEQLPTERIARRLPWRRSSRC